MSRKKNKKPKLAIYSCKVFSENTEKHIAEIADAIKPYGVKPMSLKQNITKPKMEVKDGN